VSVKPRNADIEQNKFQERWMDELASMYVSRRRCIGCCCCIANHL